jgi:site-specific DNA-methyltransferase (adenine-specific)
MKDYTLYHGDCLEVMPTLSDQSIDAIITDIPYGTTACKWDVVIPLDLMWIQLKRLAKKNAAIVLFGSQPFTSVLVTSNLKMFKYEWIWVKSRKTGFQMARKRPMKEHENILVFYDKQPTYNQELRKLEKPVLSWRKNGKGGNLLNEVKTSKERFQEFTGFYTTTIRINNEHNVGAHPTQKPVALMEYFIKTYSNEGDTILDFTMGSGTTGIAALNLNRRFIGIEKDETYFNIARERIEKAYGNE